MEKFCGSEFWNSNRTWYTNDPELTPCFEQTILVWIPCAFLLIFMFLEMVFLHESLDRNIPWNFKNISKVVLHIGLLVLCVADFSNSFRLKGSTTGVIFAVDIWGPIVKFFTFAIGITFVLLNRKYGVQTSGILFLFWLLLVIFAIPQLRTEINDYSYRHSSSLSLNDTTEELGFQADYKFYSFIIYFVLAALILILNCFADNIPKDTKYNRNKNSSPELSASFLSRVTLSWFDKMAWRGYRMPLEIKDLWELSPQESSKEVMPKFAYYWNKNVRKNYLEEKREVKGHSYLENVTFETPKRFTSVMTPLYKSSSITFLLGTFCKLVSDLLSFASPQILACIISYVEDKEDSNKESEPVWKGIFYAVLLFICVSIQTFFSTQNTQKMYLLGMRIRIALVNTIYRKSLVISNSAKKESTVGEIVNLMSVDAERFEKLLLFINLIWSTPLRIGLCIYFLWQQLGISVLAGLAVMIIMIRINMFFVNWLEVLQVKQMQYKDDRVKLINEILGGMKVLKLYAWETSFEEQIYNIRNKEIGTLKRSAYLNAAMSVFWSCSPFLVSLVTFATYVLIDDKNDLNPTKAFVSLSLFNILRFPLVMLPILVSNLVQAHVSMKRINNFLNSEELDPNCVGNDPSGPYSMSIENGTFSWGDGKESLKDITIKVNKQSLVAIVGRVGSGKSSVIAALLGEMDKIKGKVNTVGSIAYVPQQAWIQNGTLRDNILFGKSFDRKRYHEVIEACALESDILMLSAGDQTEIGEKGINLSGGQKQRVSLARAVYSDADLYLLDDPLSAVDSHVGKHIFEEVIGPTGLLAKKTRVLVTHSIAYLPKVDKIYVLKGGKVSEGGSYSELLNQRGAFSDFLIQHLNEKSTPKDELYEIQEQLEKDVQSEELRKKWVRAISRVRSASIVSASFQSILNKKGSIELKKFQRQGSVKSCVSTISDIIAGEDDGRIIEDEKAEQGGISLGVFKYFIKNLGIAMTFSSILLNFMFQVLSVGSNLWLTQWSNDKRAATDEGVRDMYLWVYGIFGLLQAVVNFGGTITVALGCVYCSKRLHDYLTRNTMRFPMDFFDITPLGRILNRFSKDFDTIDNVLNFNLRMMIVQVFLVIASITVICISTPIFLAAIVPIALVYWFGQRFYIATARQLMRLDSVTRSPIYSHFNETITGVTSIRAYKVQKRFIQISDERVDLNQTCKYPSVIANRWLAIRLEMIGNLIILCTSLFAVLGSQTNAALVGLAVTYSLQITQSLSFLMRMTSDVETNLVSVERIKEYDDVKQEAPWSIENVKTPEGWPQIGRVVFENYMVRYREGLNLALRGISFAIEGGDKVGIVGRTGAGKSSLTLALFRIIEAAGGRILIDDIDIASIGLHTLRSRLTIIPQDPVLFSGSLRLNLDPYNRNTDEEIWSALELSHLKTYVKKMSGGLNHEISEGGENFSVGQRQLVCLARALLRKTKVLIMDEATAAVDLETDNLIQKTIRSEFKNCTVLTIAHRLNTIIDSDKVIVLDKGQVVEYDSPTNLLGNKNSSFYSMAKDANLV